MDKIKNLLVKAGCSNELVDSICESLSQFKKDLREQYEAEYTSKVEEAKQVCIEETESHKRELARRLTIFCETKGAAIEQQLAKQSALNESEALAKLYAVRSAIDGLPNGEQNGNVKAVVEKAKQQVKLANEARDNAIAKANRQTAIAEKALKTSRELQTRLNKLSGATRQVATESKTPQSRRIDGSRGKTRTPVSTRPTLVENQDRRQVRPQPQPTTGSGNGFGINDIAATMESELL